MMTNGDRMRKMTDDELADELRRFGQCEFKDRVDLTAWLGQEDREYVVPGKRATVRLLGGETYTGTVTRERADGYCDLVMDADFPYASRILSSPKERVTIHGE